MSLFDKYMLKEMLQNGIVSIVFEKADGTIREMNCTLNPTEMPPQLLTEQQDAARIRNENVDLLAVQPRYNLEWLVLSRKRFFELLPECELASLL